MEVFIAPITPMKFDLDKDITEKGAPQEIPFYNVLQQAVSETQRLTEITQQDSADLAFGDVDNLAQIQINSLKAKTMLQTTVQITTRAVNAYKEIMQMQV